MIRINLLGKKKAAGIPFGLEEKFERLGINVSDVQELRPALFRVAVVVAGLYVANYIPAYLHDEKVKQLDAQLAKLTAQSGELTRELASKKDIRKQMEQLNKEEVELNRQLNAVNALQQGRSLAFNTLNDLILQLQKVGKVWVENLEFKGHKITLAGRSWEYFAINEFVKGITESTRYTNVQFKDITAEASKFKLIPGVPEALQKTKRFTLEFGVKEGE
jgi:Tfp pilus assembly protein PilN